jgi:hypothetical protein
VLRILSDPADPDLGTGNFFSVNGTESRDFLPLFFFHRTTPSEPMIHGLKTFRIGMVLNSRRHYLTKSVGQSATMMLLYRGQQCK